MNPKYTYDFSSASIKHIIEAEFYQKAGEVLPNTHISSTIVTGPDYQRHIDNHNKFINRDSIRICEIDLDIFIDIYKGCKNLKNVKVLNKSIELFGSTFIDCDLTCTSDIEVIFNTLLKQIEVQASCGCRKVFIFSFGLRTNNPKPLDQYLRPIWGLLGASVGKYIISENISPKCGKLCYKKEVIIHGTKGRIKDYICYSYNAGGGPMLTCLLIYI